MPAGTPLVGLNCSFMTASPRAAGRRAARALPSAAPIDLRPAGNEIASGRRFAVKYRGRLANPSRRRTRTAQAVGARIDLGGNHARTHVGVASDDHLARAARGGFGL